LALEARETSEKQSFEPPKHSLIAFITSSSQKIGRFSMINASRDPTLSMLGKKGSGFFTIRLAQLFWSGNEMIIDRFLAQAYDSHVGAEAGRQQVSDLLSLSPDSLHIEELSIAIADQIGFIEPNNLAGLPLRDWADYWTRKAEVARTIVTSADTPHHDTH